MWIVHRVSFLEWIRTGQFGPISAGMPTLEVFERLGYPDDLKRYAGMICTGKKRCMFPDGLVYGHVQLMFDHPEHQLHILQLDYPATPNAELTGGDLFDVDPWELRPGVPFVPMIERLRAAGIPVTQHFPRSDEGDGTARLVAGSGICLIYIVESGEFDPPVGLYSIFQVAGGPWEARMEQVRPPVRF